MTKFTVFLLFMCFISYVKSDNLFCFDSNSFENKITYFKNNRLFNIPFERKKIFSDLVQNEVCTSSKRIFTIYNKSPNIKKIIVFVNKNKISEIAINKRFTLSIDLKIGKNQIELKSEHNNSSQFNETKTIFYNPIELINPKNNITTFKSSLDVKCKNLNNNLTWLRLLVTWNNKEKEYKLKKNYNGIFKTRIDISIPDVYNLSFYSNDYKCHSIKITKKRFPFKTKLTFISYSNKNKYTSRIVDLIQNKEILWNQNEVHFLYENSIVKSKFILSDISIHNKDKYCILKSVDRKPEVLIKLYLNNRPNEYFENNKLSLQLKIEADKNYVPLGEKIQFTVSSDSVPVSRCNLYINNTIIATNITDGIFRYKFKKYGNYRVYAKIGNHSTNKLLIKVGPKKIGKFQKYNLSFKSLFQSLYKSSKLFKSTRSFNFMIKNLWPDLSFDKHYSSGWIIKNALSKNGENILKMAHLKINDIIKSIDGYNIDLFDERKSLLKKLQRGILELKNKKIIIFDIERNGNPLRIIYHFK